MIISMELYLLCLIGVFMFFSGLAVIAACLQMGGGIIWMLVKLRIIYEAPETFFKVNNIPPV